MDEEWERRTRCLKPEPKALSLDNVCRLQVARALLETRRTLLEELAAEDGFGYAQLRNKAARKD